MHLLKDSDPCISCRFFMEDDIMCITCIYKQKEVSNMTYLSSWIALFFAAVVGFIIWMRY